MKTTDIIRTSFTLLLLSLLGCGFEQEADLLTLGPTYTDWWDESWSCRRRLTFDNSGQGDLMDFPVLVRLTPGRIDYGSTGVSGEDIRFLDDDGTVLAYEIERWNQVGESVIWVRIPQIDGNSASDFMWMYYGNPGASDGQQREQTWESGYMLVWHLGDSPTGGGADVLNSTDNMTPPDTGTGTSQSMNSGNRVPGQTGNGLSFDGTNEWVEPDSPDPGFFHDQFSDKTFTAWIRSNNTGQTQTVYEEGGSTNGLHVGVVSSQVRLATRNGGSGTQRNVVQPYTDTSSFHFVAAVFESGQIRLHLDDNVPAVLDTGYTSINTHSGEPGVGCSPDSDAVGTGPGEYFTGDMDEVRISHVARPAGWIAAQYLSMSDGFIMFEEEQRLQ